MELTRAAKPNGETWAQGHPSEGQVIHYRELQIDDYLIGMNATGFEERGFGPEQVYQLEVPADSAVDVETGEEITSDFVNVAGGETRVLRIEQ